MNIAPSAVGTIAALYRYPIKSMLGEAVAQGWVDQRGMRGDRAYALRERESGVIASGKHPRKWGALLGCHARFTAPPGMRAALPPVTVRLPDGSELTTDQDELSPALSRLLGRQVDLVASAPEDARAETYWPEVAGFEIQNQVTERRLGVAVPGALYEYGPLHLLTTATLAHLARLYPAGRFEAERFRPNLLIDTGGADSGFLENAWLGRTLAVGDTVRLQVIDPCPRCVVTTVAQGDLPADPGILATIARHSSATSVTAAPGVLFRAVTGVYAAVLQPGLIRTGDTLRLE